MDEEHSLRLAMRRLATDEQARASLGRAGRRYWKANHSIDVMAADYRRLVDALIAEPEHPLVPAAPLDASLPGHLFDDGSATLRRIMQTFDLPIPFRSDL
jgi:hypothetical protein